MSFIRSKKVGEHIYYQEVENYRDESGKHKQRVLKHFGTQDPRDLKYSASDKRGQTKQSLPTTGGVRHVHALILAKDTASSGVTVIEGLESGSLLGVVAGFDGIVGVRAEDAPVPFITPCPVTFERAGDGGELVGFFS